jgi:hypothetical protein
MDGAFVREFHLLKLGGITLDGLVAWLDGLGAVGAGCQQGLQACPTKLAFLQL